MNQFLDNYQREVITETYNVAIYCRISNKDDDKAESNSISNQKNILIRYVSERGWNSAGTYVDDGYSGFIFMYQNLIKCLRISG